VLNTPGVRTRLASIVHDCETAGGCKCGNENNDRSGLHRDLQEKGVAGGEDGYGTPIAPGVTLMAS
jgi:hypothetical protein